MLQVAIVGAGELGGAVAWALARSDLTMSVCLVDQERQTAAGKALDIMQAGPIEGFATRVSGSHDVFAAAGASVVVLADRSDRSGPHAEWLGEEGLAMLERLGEIARDSLILCAGSTQRDLVERAVLDRGFDRGRLFGSAPEALASAIRVFVALEANGSPRDVALTVLGVPPASIVVPWEQSAIGGLSLTSVLDSQAIRRLASRVAPLWPPGPYALAAAAIKAIESISGASRRVSCFVVPGESSGIRRRAIALPVRLGPRGVDAATVPALSARDQVMLENAMLL
jgi:malate dehydrogenase